MLLCLLLTGCGGHTYFNRNVTAAMLTGTWLSDHTETEAKALTVHSNRTILGLWPNGRFEARSLPIMVNNVFQYVSDHGTWTLQDRGIEPGTSRWRIVLHLEQHRSNMGWNLYDSGQGLPSLGCVCSLGEDSEDCDALILTKSSSAEFDSSGPAE